MSIITQGLRAAMQAYHQDGHHLGVLVIDEQTAGPYPTTPFQQQVLGTANLLGLPVWIVELNPGVNAPAPPPNLPTQPALANLVPGAQVVTKPHINAFASNAQPNLHGVLQAANIDMLVVMGYNTNCCVRATSVGAADGPGPNARHRPGATQLGYTVLTADQVLRGGVATWKREQGVRFYTAV